MADLVKFSAELVSKSPQLDFDTFGFSATLGKIVFAYRIREGLTQAQLADLAGLGPKTIHRIEGGSNNITSKTYGKVFNVLKITLNELAEAFTELKVDTEKKAESEQKELMPQLV